MWHAARVLFRPIALHNVCIKIVRTHLPDARGFADDTQLYLSFKPIIDISTNQVETMCAMENCIAELRQWMLQDKLMINDSKTEFLIIGSRQQLEKVYQCSIGVGDSNVQPVFSARNLVSWFNSNSLMSVHVTKFCGAAFFGYITLNVLVGFTETQIRDGHSRVCNEQN